MRNGGASGQWFKRTALCLGASYPTLDSDDGDNGGASTNVVVVRLSCRWVSPIKPRLVKSCYEPILGCVPGKMTERHEQHRSNELSEVASAPRHLLIFDTGRCTALAQPAAASKINVSP